MCSRTIDDRLIYVSTGSAVVNAKRARIFALPSRSFSSSPPIIFRESRFLACSFDESRDPSLLSRARVSAQVFRRKKNLRMKVYIYIYIYTSAPSLVGGREACSCKQVVRVRCLYELYARERSFKQFIFNR